MSCLIGMAIYSTPENKKDECLEQTLQCLKKTEKNKSNSCIEIPNTTNIAVNAPSNKFNSGCPVS